MNKIGTNHHSGIPVIDVNPLVVGPEARHDVAAKMGQACREYGLFYVVGHGVDEYLQRRLEELRRDFLAQELGAKLQASMSRGGRAWPGQFPMAGCRTFGRP